MVVVCLLAPVMVFGARWAAYKKPWLMDDFRSGYAEGTRVLGLITDREDVAQRCGELMAREYGGPPEYVQYDTPEPASAFWWGCNVAVSGSSNDWWNVSGYLTA